MTEAKWYTGEFIKIFHETPCVKRFWVRLRDIERFDFKAGQFVQIELPIHEKKTLRMRSYSISSPPDGTNVIELPIVLVTDGLATPYLFNKVRPGDTVPVRGPLGKFILPDPIEDDICFICTGTGIAPFRSMLLDIYNKKIKYKNLFLIFGCRLIGDILYYQEMQELVQKLPGFQYTITLSRETNPAWNGRKGYVHGVYEEIFADHHPAHFYLCGWKNMVDEARKRLQGMGYGKEQIHVEIYG